MTNTALNTAHLYHTYDGFCGVQRHYSHMLQGCNVPLQTFYVPTRFGETHILVAGNTSKPPLLLIHGLANPSVMWQPNFYGLAENFLVYAVDVIGDAGRSAPERPSMLDASYANWLVDVLDQLALSRADIVGMSLGGWVTLSTALHHPSRVRAAFLIAPAGLTTLNTSLITQAAFSLPLWGTRFSMPDLLSRLAKHGDRDIKQLIYLVARHHRAKGVPPVPILADHELQKITAPTAILIGNQDEMFAAGAMLRRAHQMPGFTGAEVVANAGHGINSTHISHTNKQIQAFFEECVG